MDPILANLFWILIGAVIGVYVTRILDKPIERQQQKFYYWSRGLISRFRKLDINSIAQDEFRVGEWHAGYVIVEGSTSDPYIPSNVVCLLDPTPLQLPPDRQEKRTQIEKEQLELEKATGHRKFHCGPTVALSGMGRGQIGMTEEPFLVLRLRPSDYYTYLATAMSLDDPVQIEQGNTMTVRDRYLRNSDYKSPIPEFASAISLNLSLITSDGFIVVCKRAREGVLGYSSSIVAAMGECINPVLDRDAMGTVSLLATARRAASNELNIEITDSELVFFTVGVPSRLYFYEITGLIRSKTFSRADILARRSLGSKEQWETAQLYFLAHDLESVARFMSETSRTENWSPGGLVCLIQTLIHEFGTKAVERALSKYPPSKHPGAD